MRKLLPLVLGGALSIAAIAPAAAAPPTAISGANGLVNVVVQAVIDQVDVDLLNNSANDLIDVNINDSLNNALQNALQNARILNGLTVTIENLLNDLSVNVEDVTVTVADGGISINVLGAGGVADTILVR